MKIKSIAIRNFRRLEDVTIDIEDDETVFVGPNNSGKTSATAIFRCFLGGKEIKIFDFSAGKIETIDEFGDDDTDASLPAIELDLWFTIDPDQISFGRTFSLLPKLSDNFDTVGARMKYEVRDAKKLLDDYHDAYPKQDGTRKRTLSEFLGLDQNLKRHFKTTYHSLDATNEAITEQALDEDEGKSLLRELVRVDFVDAQRNIDDEEKSRSNKLSAAFAAFYKKNLEQAEAAESAHKVIDDNNDELTKHYAKHFSSLIGVIKGLGVPSINDRDLRIVSTLSPETALSGNTELFYRDANRDHELPEVYNGLGFKNLIYMAIQISHYHLQWLTTETNRPLCQLIFIEEPEVHLHAQVQQTFINNIRSIITQAAKEAKEPTLIPQFLVTTHSSHILDTVDFEKVRFFQRCALEGENPDHTTTLNASKVHDLKRFKPKPTKIDDTTIDPEETLRFLQRYVRTTHCDLFFADAAILVEGTVEKLLLPEMIEQSAPGLRSAYLSIMEVGGAYAHRFFDLLHFLKIPYVVITDLDSVDPKQSNKACRADNPGSTTSNATLKQYFDKKAVQELLALTPEEKADSDRDCYVTFQTTITVTHGDQTLDMTPRTLEEAFAYTNFDLIKDDSLPIGKEIPKDLDKAYETIYSHVKSSNFKKTEFALNVLTTSADWKTPQYIAEGLEWLQDRLRPNPESEQQEEQ